MIEMNLYLRKEHDRFPHSLTVSFVQGNKRTEEVQLTDDYEKAKELFELFFEMFSNTPYLGYHLKFAPRYCDCSTGGKIVETGLGEGEAIELRFKEKNEISRK